MGIIQDVTSGIFKNSGGSIMGDMFGYEGADLVSYLNTVFTSPKSDVIKYFYQQLYRDFAPDINGYTLVFFIPPHLSGYDYLSSSNHYSQDDKDSYMNIVGKIMTFAAIDFTPPQSQIRSENISLRSGAVPIASEVSETDTCSITFIDNRQLDIYMFHHIWIEYIREILEGTIEPNPGYYTSPEESEFSDAKELYSSIDYAASFYIVKYRPDMQTVTFVSKCVGVFPQSLPNKELIGSRTTNEMVTLPFTYSCSGYREALYTENTAISGTRHWLFDELDEVVQKFASQDESGMFGGFLGGVLNTALGSTSGALKNLTGNAAKLGGIVGSTVSGVKSMWGSIQGVAKANGFQEIFNIKNNNI